MLEHSSHLAWAELKSLAPDLPPRWSLTLYGRYDLDGEVGGARYIQSHYYYWRWTARIAGRRWVRKYLASRGREQTETIT